MASPASLGRRKPQLTGPAKDGIARRADELAGNHRRTAGASGGARNDPDGGSGSDPADGAAGNAAGSMGGEVASRAGDVSQGGAGVGETAAGTLPGAQAECRVSLRPSTSPQAVSSIGGIGCDRGASFSVIQHRDASWVLLSPPRPDFPRLHAFAGGAATGYEIPSDLSGHLWHSAAELPAILGQTWGQDCITTLSVGLPDHIHQSAVRTKREISPKLSDTGVFWATDASEISADGGPTTAIHYAASLAEPPTTVSYPELSLEPKLVPYAKSPAALARDKEQWYAVTLAGKTPLGIPASVDGRDWLLDGDQAVTLLETPSDLPGPAPSQARLISVLGAQSDFAAQRLVAMAGYSVDEARIIQSDPQTPVRIAAPVLVLHGAYWVGGGASPGCERDCHDSPYAYGLQKALARLGRDSAGDAWLVAAVTTADVVETTGQYVYLGERWKAGTWTSLYKVSVELRLIRLAMPYLERRITIQSSGDGDTDLVLDMVGARGTLAKVSGTSVILWSIDLDAAG